jgi:hypothetical protein
MSGPYGVAALVKSLTGTYDWNVINAVEGALGAAGHYFLYPSDGQDYLTYAAHVVAPILNLPVSQVLLRMLVANNPYGSAVTSTGAVSATAMTLRGALQGVCAGALDYAAHQNSVLALNSAIVQSGVGVASEWLDTPGVSGVSYSSLSWDL